MNSYLTLGTKLQVIKLWEEEFKVFQYNNILKKQNTQWLMMSLVGCFNTVTAYIFGAIDYQLKRLGNRSIFYFYPSNHITETIKFFNYDVQMVLKVRKTNKSWMKLKLGQSMLLKAVVMRMFQGFLSWLSKQNTINNDTLMLMWKSQ